MDGEKDLLWLGQRAPGSASARRTICHRIAGDVNHALFAADPQKYLVDRVVQIEQAQVRLQTELRVGTKCRQVCFRQLRLSGFVEGFDLGPLKANHVDRDFFDTLYELGMRAQPQFQSRSEIAQCE